MSAQTLDTQLFPYVPWDEFMAHYFTWRQGEHVAVVAPTGQGKTWLTARILEKRRHVVVMATKGKDRTLSTQFRGYDVIDSWPPKSYQERLLLWPRTKGDSIPAFVANQRRVMRNALNSIFREEGWCMAIDEEHWFVRNLKLGLEIETFLNQARSAGLTMVNGVQRPAFVPIATFSGASHAFVGKFSEEDDIKRLAGLGGIDRKSLALAIRGLDRKNHEFLYIDATGEKSPVRTSVR